jgi:hypothetical protein
MRASTIGRLWARVDRSAGFFECWPWTGTRSPKGYGFIWLDGTNRRVHRVVYELAIGPIPDDMWVLHHCDNPPCCNPAHLWLGTNADNMRDMLAKGRGAQMRPFPICRSGRHEMSGTNVIRSVYDGRRRCRACATEHAQRKAAAA